MSKLTAIDLFAGAGGFSLAAHEAGFNLLAAVEFDDHAANTYQENIVKRLKTSARVYAQDINQLDIMSFMSELGLSSGELDLLLGGPPCQGFSTHRIKNSGGNDPRNRLLVKYFDFVEHLRPKVFLVENVPGLLWPRHEKHLNKFLKLAREHRYRVISDGPLIINARDYGVPQNRRRAFILAVRDDIAIDGFMWPPIPSHVKPDFDKPLAKNVWKSASTVFEKPPKKVLNKLIPRMQKVLDWDKDKSTRVIESLTFGAPLPDGDWCNRHMVHKPFMVERFKDTELMGSRDEHPYTLKCHENGYAGHKDVYGRMFFHTPSNTITTGCHNPSKGRFLHPWENHGITLRHAARLQTFPDEFQFIGGVMAASRQIGNAVPVLLGKALITPIKESLLSRKQ
ncbi:DNA cytosine methyltransferase [Pseudoalteromonas sp. A757]|uniref:DNA cytosine methyltransferase n=1 Tax=Pseudoalteromonas sp. A757 TaxID=2250709 RepID=UPI000FFE6F75|nr:DNA cytosine methyltransferase [Pseudoalteromonas sp. A757]RXE86241.1 DNA cytosine methyltransferase [Pseudoalteromonas sp. A757]